MANHLDKIGDDLVENTNLLDFVIHLGDIINHNTGQVNGVGLPFFVNQYKNNLKAYLIDHLNLPFHCVLGNHDLVDYKKNPDDPYNLTKSLIDELSMNNPVYAEFYLSAVFAQYMDSASFYFKTDARSNLSMFKKFNNLSCMQNENPLYS